MKGCAVSIDELKNDPQDLNIYSKEELILSETRDHLDTFDEDQTVFIDTMNDAEQYEMLSQMIDLIQNPQDNDYLQVFFDLQEMLDIKKRDTAEFMATEHARECGL